MNRLSVITFVLAAATPLLQANVIVSVPGPGDRGLANRVMETSFTTTSSYSNVAISANVQNIAGTIAGAWLTTQIGPGATSAEQIATTTIPLSNGGDVSLFSGLNLNPGIYYLVLSFNSGGLASVWNVQPSASPVTLDSGVTLGASMIGTFADFPAFGPSETFSGLSSTGASNADHFMFSVTGTSSTTPEPSSVALFASAILALLPGFRKRLNGRNSGNDPLA
jgi:hypothetical protein